MKILWLVSAESGAYCRLEVGKREKNMPVILQDITKKYGEQVVLSHVNLRIEDGERLCLMGPSGSGKTTLLSVLAGLVQPEEGTVSGVKKGGLSMIFQEDRLIEGKDAFTNLSLVLKNKLTQEEMRREYARVGLTDYEGKPVSEFSGGMKRRVAIVRAVCADAGLILMDEPFKGLDTAIREQVISYVRERTAGRTVLLVTHDMAEAELMAAKILNITNISNFVL